MPPDEREDEGGAPRLVRRTRADIALRRLSRGGGMSVRSTAAVLARRLRKGL